MDDHTAGMDDELVVGFLGGVRVGTSCCMTIEGGVLGINGDDLPPWAVLIRLAPDCHLLRSDAAERAQDALRACVRAHLRGSGAAPVDIDPPELSDVAAMCVTGIRMARWELWAADDAAGRRALEAALMGDPRVRAPTNADATEGHFGARLLQELDTEMDEIARGLWRDDD